MNLPFAEALPLSILLMLTVCAGAEPATQAAPPDCVALDGTPTPPNPVEKDGRILHFKAPALARRRTSPRALP